MYFTQSIFFFFIQNIFLIIFKSIFVSLKQLFQIIVFHLSIINWNKSLIYFIIFIFQMSIYKSEIIIFKILFFQYFICIIVIFNQKMSTLFQGITLNIQRFQSKSDTVSQQKSIYSETTYYQKQCQYYFLYFQLKCEYIFDHQLSFNVICNYFQLVFIVYYQT
ncbi:hypothetical protein IMG5_111680 [Ichthyophthirius multifiliis]|uniref:Transmembrane protein n=1 Tax=Ichthyophthirius multifiliis TaxID=5932 RepID=G0QTT8_ICHMU|nr:hypothetical protein IMG5_111680 [Ichthyophthirius multifiliis]EGR31363.1 hypothetical protein IMG5_111680 [Ichthyophthirius multifiliis]|eukprot:XP_004034849.1 hypothetical protein IMG5_111680 [Ichthyophthirius multifiliis]